VIVFSIVVWIGVQLARIETVMIARIEDYEEVGKGQKTAYKLWRNANVAEIASKLRPVELALAEM
jgi:hypothetical protein